MHLLNLNFLQARERFQVLCYEVGAIIKKKDNAFSCRLLVPVLSFISAVLRRLLAPIMSFISATGSDKARRILIVIYLSALM